MEMFQKSVIKDHFINLDNEQLCNSQLSINNFQFNIYGRK